MNNYQQIQRNGGPRDIRGHSIASRFFLAPINTGFAVNGSPLKKFWRFFSQRSGHDIGITYVGNVSVGPKWCTNGRTPYFKGDLTQWRELSRLIEGQGSLPGLQLGCRVSNLIPQITWRRRAPKAALHFIRDEVKAIPDSLIEEVIESFITSARLAIESGFNVVQIHAAHGYFLARLLSTMLNRREDWIGKNPALVIRRIVEGIRRISSSAIIDVRISLREGFSPWGVERSERERIVGQIAQTDVDMISLSNGNYDFDKTLIYPPRRWVRFPSKPGHHSEANHATIPKQTRPRFRAIRPPQFDGVV